MRVLLEQGFYDVDFAFKRGCYTYVQSFLFMPSLKTYQEGEQPGIPESGEEASGSKRERMN
jgi:hypothetical protein